MKTFLIKNKYYPLLQVVKSDSPAEAWTKAMVNQAKLEDFVADNQELIQRGYHTMFCTHLDNVWELL